METFRNEEVAGLASSGQSSAVSTYSNEDDNQLIITVVYNQL